VSGYNVTVGSATRQVQTFQEAAAFVAEGVTSLLAQDPEGVAEGAMTANRAFSGGLVQHALDTDGIWRMTVTVHGEPVPVVVSKRLR
jgi:hypothetical protein